jgi:hypothetical protein
MRLMEPQQIYVPGDSRVHRTAAAELQRHWPGATLHRQDTAPAGSLYLALVGESALTNRLIRRGLCTLHTVAPGIDAFDLIPDGGALVALATTLRGLLQAAYEVRDWLHFDGTLPETVVSARFTPSQRIFHQRFDAWPGTRDDVRFISQTGATHCLIAHDWQAQRTFQHFVTSPLFPHAVDTAEVAVNAAALRQLLDDCADYGLEAAFWLIAHPCQGGPWVPEPVQQQFLTRYDAEVLSDSGTYEGQVLCFGHPRVQAFYRDLLARFFSAFPEIGTLFLFGRDSGGEFCNPHTCPRCAGVSLFEQRDRFIRFLVEEGGRLRPGLRVLTTGWKWDEDPEAFLRHQAALPPVSGLYQAAQKDGWQPERQAHDFLCAARQVCREHGQIFIGYDDFFWGDDTVHHLRDIQDYPLGIGAKLRRWHDLQVDGVFDHWGGRSEEITSNAPACRAFFINPYADTADIGREIALRQFGDAAGTAASRAWQALERAHAILSNACTWSPWQWPEWYSGRIRPPLPEAFDARRNEQDAHLPPERPTPLYTYNGGGRAGALQAVHDAWELAAPWYQEATAALTDAIALADDSPIGYAHWWSGVSAVPSRREHLRRQRLYVQSMAVVGREIGLDFGLQALYERVSRDHTAYRTAAHALLAADAQACWEAAALMTALRESGDDRHPSRSWAELYMAKAAAISGFRQGIMA